MDCQIDDRYTAVIFSDEDLGNMCEGQCETFFTVKGDILTALFLALIQIVFLIVVEPSLIVFKVKLFRKFFYYKLFFNGYGP